MGTTSHGILVKAKLKDKFISIFLTPQKDSTYLKLGNSTKYSKISPIFMDIKNVFTCFNNLWDLPPSVFNYPTDQEYIYIVTDPLVGTLKQIDQKLTIYEFKCLLFELLYPRTKGLSYEIGSDDILYTTSDKDRLYKVGQTRYMICSKYVPIISHVATGAVKDSKSGVSDLSGSDLLEIVDSSADLEMQMADWQYKIDDFFDDLVYKQGRITTYMRRGTVVKYE